MSNYVKLSQEPTAQAIVRMHADQDKDLSPTEKATVEAMRKANEKRAAQSEREARERGEAEERWQQEMSRDLARQVREHDEAVTDRNEDNAIKTPPAK